MLGSKKALENVSIVVSERKSLRCIPNPKSGNVEGHLILDQSRVAVAVHPTFYLDASL